MNAIPASPPPVQAGLYPDRRRNLWRVIAAVAITSSILLTEAILVSTLGDKSVFQPFPFVQQLSYGLSLTATSLAIALVWLLMEKQKTRGWRVGAGALIVLLPVVNMVLEPLNSRLVTGYWQVPQLQEHAGDFLWVGLAAWAVLTMDTLVPWRGLGLLIGILTYVPLYCLILQHDALRPAGPWELLWPPVIMRRLTFILPLLFMKLTSRRRV
jgi:hypothetical protein